MGPTYIVIGCGKAGTTTLCGLLARHPDVFLTDPKETNFFALDELYSRGTGWYESLYAGAAGFAARGEGSPLYTFRKVYPDAPKRIADYDPGLKLIYIVRHPLRRLESAWVEMRSWGDEQAHHDFRRALRDNRDWLLESTDYTAELAAYRKHVPDERILVLFFEDMVRDTTTVLRTTFRFLGVDPDAGATIGEAHLNRSADKRTRRAGVSTLRSLPVIGPLYGALTSIVPEALRAPIRDRLLNARAERPTWDDTSRRFVLDELGANTRRFLERHGKSADFWNLDT